MNPKQHPSRDGVRLGRRDALRAGGIGISLAALVAACGDDREGDTAPGRVGYASTPTALPSYPVDDSVYLRTSTSVEVTIVDVYEQVLALDVLADDVSALIEALIARHEALVEQFVALTEEAGGTPWTCANPWVVDRLIEPVFAAVDASDDAARDVFNVAVALENWAAATHQSFTSLLTDPALRTGVAAAAATDSRNSATLVAVARGQEGYVSPAIGGGEVPVVDGIPEQFAITSRFGSTAQFELVVGPPDENGVRLAFIINTPAENSFIYNELEPSC